MPFSMICTSRLIPNSGYYKLDEELVDLRFSNKPVLFKTEKEIREQGTTNYIVIEDKNFNKSSCSFTIEVFPPVYGLTILANYYLIDNKWIRK